MPALDQYTKRIHEKVQQLLNQYFLLQNENKRLKTELANLKSSSKEKDELVSLLELRIDVLKAAKGEMTEEEKKSFEKKISFYLKEIDKAIALMNE